jgi:hypothetical protein
MAGRPRKQFERIDEIYTRTAVLYRDLDQFTPQMHKLRAGSGDRLGAAWLSALSAAKEAHQEIHSLRAILALRAGMGAIGDLSVEVTDAGYDESCNPTADDATTDSVIVIDGDAATLEWWAQEFNRPIDMILDRFRVRRDWEEAIMDPIEQASEIANEAEAEQL